MMLDTDHTSSPSFANEKMKKSQYKEDLKEPTSNLMFYPVGI